RSVTAAGAERLARGGDRWTVQTPQGSFGARDVVVATNGYSGPASPPLQRCFVPVGSHIIAPEPLSPSLAASLIPKRRMAFDSKYFLHYFRLAGDRLLFGGRAAAGLHDGMIAVFPQLAGARIDYPCTVT